MLKIEIIVFSITFASLFYAEVVAWRHGKQTLNKYLAYFFISIFLFALVAVFRVVGPDDSLFTSGMELGFGMAGTFLLLVYLVFRGMLVLVDVFSARSDRDAAHRAMERLINRPLRAYIFIVVFTIVSNAGAICSMWFLWQLVREIGN
jgi:hypothetical protein